MDGKIKKVIGMKVYVEAKTNKVYFSVTMRGKRFYVYTGMETTEKFSGMVFPRSDKSNKAKTRRLAELFSQCESYVLDHGTETNELMKEHLKEICTGVKKSEKSPFLDFMQKVTDSKLNQNTKRSYERTMHCVEAFDRTCTFATMTEDWVNDFIRHERNKGRCNNGISADLTHVKSVFKRAIESGLTSNYPFHSVRLKKEETKKRCLSLEQMRYLRDAKMWRKQAMFRDFFMLGFYLIGINVSDLLALKRNDLKNGRISYYRNKTGRLYDIKVEPEALEIINRHRSRKKDYLLSFFEEAGTFDVNKFTCNMNRVLRRMGPRDPRDMRRASPTPVDKSLSTYYNRHTWATFASEIGIPLETIGRALGHSIWDRSITSVYVKYDTKAIDEANRKVIDYLNSDKNESPTAN